jgi:hypothetical protein
LPLRAWKTLIAALLPQELVRVKTLVKTEEKLRRLETAAVPRAQMKTSARPLEGRGHAELWISAVLRLLDYQHHGPIHAAS